VGGVDEPVEDGLGDDGVGEPRIPVFGAAVGGEHEGPPGAFGEQLVEIVGLGGGEVPHGEVIQDDQVGLGPAAQPSRPGVVGVAARQVGEEPAGLRERHAVTVTAGLMAEGLSDERLADTDGPVEDDRLAAFDESQWNFDPDDAQSVARRSILPQFFGDADQPDAIDAVRRWCAGLYEALDQEDALIASGALRALEVPVSIIFGEEDRYLTPALAAEISELFDHPSMHLVQDAGHWVQHDQPTIVADLLKQST
jgi:pimeloyl-ACP methyl ester carboxylesterase